MSANEFKATIWEANILATLKKDLVFESPMITNRNYEGTVQGGGVDRVKLLQIGSVTINDYSEDTDLTYQRVTGAAQWLDIDKKKSFSFSVDDVEQVQSNVDLIAAYSQEAGYQISDTVDQDGFSLHASAGITSGLGTTATPLTVTAADSTGGNVGVLELLRRIRVALDKNNVRGPHFLVLTPDIAGRLAERNVTLYNVLQTQQAADNGFIGSFYGFNMFTSNNLADVGTTATPKQKLLAGSNLAITFASQISKVEQIRLQGSFKTAIRGLYVYGRKVVRPEALACITVTPT